MTEDQKRRIRKVFEEQEKLILLFMLGINLGPLRIPMAANEASFITIFGDYP
jgi:hypothetical protein